MLKLLVRVREPTLKNSSDLFSGKSGAFITYQIIHSLFLVNKNKGVEKNVWFNLSWHGGWHDRNRAWY
jgi:hypothetical protein